MTIKGKPIQPFVSELSGLDMTAKLAHELWSYDATEGVLRWRVCCGHAIEAGDIAGTISSWGYRIVTFKGKKYRTSRLVWLMETGIWPERFIDHINGNRADDRLPNLRQANDSQNVTNKCVMKNNKLGVKGVSWSKKDKRYCAFIRVDKRNINLGQFLTIAEAKTAYDVAAIKHHGEFARL